MKVLVILLASCGMLVKAEFGDRQYQQQGGYPQQLQHPGPDYGPPGPGFAAGPAYGAPGQGFAAAPGYGPPNPGFAAAPGYGAPGPGFAAGPAYAQPGPAYGPPAHHGGLAPSIGAPQPHFGRHQAPIIHKHVYVHVPPPEPYFPKLRKPLAPLPPPQKHYKIIFIKAPSPAPLELPEVPLIPPAPEVKTLVYVLTKKPEPLPELNIPIPPPPAQHKPEVFFIRYKSPGDIEQAVLNAGGPVGGGQFSDENQEALLAGGFNQQDGGQRQQGY